MELTALRRPAVAARRASKTTHRHPVDPMPLGRRPLQSWPWLGSLCLAALLSACPAPAPTTVSAAPGPAVIPAAVPDAPPTSAPHWSGTAQINGQPFGSAEVRLITLGRQSSWSTATTDPAGRFALPVPDALDRHGLLVVLARKNGTTLATLVATDDKGQPFTTVAEVLLRLDETTTMAYLSLLERLQALNADATLDVGQAIQAFRTVVAGITLPPQANGRPAWLQTAITILDEWGRGRLPTGAAADAMTDMPTFREAFLRAAAMVLTKVTIGSPVDPLPFGNALAPGVGGGSGGGGTGAGPLPIPSLSGTITVNGTARAKVLVQLTDSSGFVRKTATDPTGRYDFYDIPAGTYTLVCAVDGAVQEQRTVTIP